MLGESVRKNNTEEDREQEIREPDTMESGDEDQVMPTSMKRKRSSLSSDGVDGGTASHDDLDEDTAPNAERSPSPPPLGKLHKRRASASPQKFSKGHFEPLPLRTNVDKVEPPAKKARDTSNIEITYDSNGTPRIASYSSNVQPRNEEANLDGLATLASPRTATRSASDTSSARSISASFLLNESRPSPGETKKQFSLLHAICRDNDLLLHFVSYISIPSLISLYSISKPFHYLFNRHHTAFILSYMRTWAPKADRIYPWRCYKSLCAKDPSKLQKLRLAGREDEVNKKWDDLRDVPSLRWLQMVIWREGVCRDMLIQLAIKGLRCPPGTLDSIKRMWFILDLPLNAHRIALIRNTQYIPDGVLHGIAFFLVKVDMHFTDPVHPPYPTNHPNQLMYPNRWAGGLPSGVPLRKMLLAERSLTPLWRVLRGWSWDPQDPQRPITRLDVLRLWIRHKYTPPENQPDEVKKMSVMGIPWWEVGTAGLERTGVSFHNLGDKQVSLAHPSIAGTGLAAHKKHQLLYPHRRQIHLENEKPREPLLRPDELIVREGVRRKLSMHKKWAIMMFWGFCDSLGVEFPILTEGEYLRMQKGLPPRPPAKKDEKTQGEDRATEGKQNEASAENVKETKTPAVATSSTLWA